MQEKNQFHKTQNDYKIEQKKQEIMMINDNDL